MKANLSSIQTKLLPVLFGLALFAVAFSAVKGMVYGNVSNVKMLAGLVVIGGLILALDDKYWLLFPVFSVLSVNIPGIPFQGLELGCIIVVAVYILRLVLQKEKTTKIKYPLTLAMPFLLWILFVWCLNPTGLAMFGSTTIGARFYLKIILGFCFCCVMCTKAINEKEAKIFFYCMVVSQIINAFISIFASNYLVAEEIAVDEDRAHYEILFALSLYFLIFCKYSLSEIIKSIWRLLLVFILALLTVYTGKRKGIATLVLLPLIRTFITGKDKMLTLFLMICSSFLMLFVVAGDGVLYDLPYSVKRSLSVVVPKYRESEVVQDIFREEIRQRGDVIIKESPWFGRKGFAMDLRETAWLMSFDDGVNYEAHVYTGNWHSIWYAYACDFGVPCAIFVYIFLFALLFYSIKLTKKSKYGSFVFVVLLYYAFNVCLLVIFSYTSGHSSHTTITVLTVIGILVALENGMKQNQSLELVNSIPKIV